MMSNSRSVAFVPACVAAGGFLAAAVLFGILSITPGGAREVEGAPLVQEVMPAADEHMTAAFEMPPPRAFVEIVTRPLFAPNRRPTAEQEITIETVTSELELRLVGVIVASGTPMAIIAPNGSSEFARLTVGDRFQGWTVAQIEPHRVTFRRDQAVERVELSYDLPPASRPKVDKVQTGENNEPVKEKD